MKTYKCPECKRLEQDLDRVMQSIGGIARGRFESIEEKIRRLHAAQDLRDEVARRYFSHVKSHPRGGEVAETESSARIEVRNCLKDI